MNSMFDIMLKPAWEHSPIITILVLLFCAYLIGSLVAWVFFGDKSSGLTKKSEE